jgi:PKD repeat protein
VESCVAPGLALILLFVLAAPVSGTVHIIDTTMYPTSAQFQDFLNTTASGDTVAFTPGIYRLQGIWFNKTLTFCSNGGIAQDTIIDGIGGNNGIFYNTSGSETTITIKDLTLRNGYTALSQGGGAVSSYGNITVISSDFYNDTAPGKYGGAMNIHGSGNLTVSGSNFTWCRSEYGGAISTQFTYVFVNSSSFVNCQGRTNSGAVYTELGGAVNFCRFDNTTSGDNTVITNEAGASAVDMTENWWGNNAPPASLVSGGNLNPFLVLGVTATPSSITTAQTSIISANLSYDSAGIRPAANILPDGIPVYFTMGSGPGSVPPGVVLTTNHLAAGTFTPSEGGSATVNASVDGCNVSAFISISSFPVIVFTGTPVSGNLPLTVTFNDTSTGIPSPSTWNWSFGDGQWFNTTNSATKNTSHTYTAPGTYPVNLTANNTAGAGTLSRTGYITVMAPVPPTSAPVLTYPPGQSGGNNDDGPTITYPLMTVTVNIGGDSSAWQAIVTGTKLSDLIVTGNVQSGQGSNLTAPPGIVYQYISIVPARYTSITNAVINFTIPQSWLDNNHIETGSIVLYHQTANGWTTLPTTLLFTKDGTVYFSATSPGFSLFAIAGTPVVTAPATVAISQGTVTNGVPEQTPVRAVSTQAPVTAQTTAPPATTARPSAPSPLMDIVLVIAAIGVMGGGGFLARRWWIRCQNPALFRKFD